MDLKEYFSQLAEFSVKPLFKIAGTEVSLLSIFLFFFAILVSFTISTVFQRGLQRSLAQRFKEKEGTLAAVLRLVHYTVLVIGFGVALQTIGINLSTLFAAGAIFAIAIGFAMQNVVQNFVSGIILLVERTIKPGDVIEVEGTVVKVIDMGIRTTVVRTWREEDLIMPNSVFSQSTVKNYTLRDNDFRLGVEVGVTYDSDMKKVMEVLEKTAKEVPWRFKNVDPSVLLTDFGDSAVIFGVYLNINDPWKQRIYMSDLRKAIWFAFKKENIVIAFNQMDVHFDPPVTNAIASLRKAA